MTVPYISAMPQVRILQDPIGCWGSNLEGKYLPNSPIPSAPLGLGEICVKYMKDNRYFMQNKMFMFMMSI